MNEISRINGINSDYEMTEGGVIEEVNPGPKKLFMRLFICPYRKPNKLKQRTGICEGKNTSCPSPDKIGHALVELHEKDGIKLMTDDGNQLVVDQEGNIRLDANIAVKVKNTLSVKDAFTVSVTNNTVSLEGPNGAKIVMNSNGNIEIFTAGNTGDVTVRGNLKYTGTLTKIP